MNPRPSLKLKLLCFGNIRCKQIKIHDILNSSLYFTNILMSALSLHNRPIFHASSLIPVAVGCIWFISYLRSNDILKRLSLIFLVAWTSHHIRDGTRRGLWFPPFGSTQPLPKTTYVILIMCLPLLLRGVLYLTEQRQSYINPIQRELVKV
ncbi:Hypothetical predicted protein [Mytilus galloprovincialis]|uniref:Transmembrane protein 267 n=1 Tax=Mytilus galloprovincialis TaxID=29158 RepID=A0A8B6FUL7_MYTGA|nr:Hypothetical predicted protein [Mytilus galloprovincialis]